MVYVSVYFQLFISTFLIYLNILFYISLFFMFLSKFDLIRGLNKLNFPTPNNLGVLWNLGFSIFILFLIQIISGLFLSIYVDVNLLKCLDSKIYISKEINCGWMFSNLHMIVPEYIFIFIYLHVVKNLLYPIYSLYYLWESGALLYIFFIIISFTGYSLISGSMGYWAVVVVCNILRFILGDYISEIIFYDFSNGSISNLSIYKIFTIHYFISFLVFIIIFIHLWALHINGSSGLFSNFYDYSSFLLILLIKDFLIFFYIFIIISISIFFYPEYFYSFDNYREISFFTVPEEINSEWYLRFFFILLRSTDSKLLGVSYIIITFMFLMLIPIFRDLSGEFYLGQLLCLLFLLFCFGIILLSFYFYGGSLYSNSYLLLIFFLLFIESIFINFLNRSRIILINF